MVTSSEGEQIWTQSIIGVIIQALVCKRCRPIDLGVLVALAVIDLFKPYFLIICGFTLYTMFSFYSTARPDHSVYATNNTCRVRSSRRYIKPPQSGAVSLNFPRSMHN